MTFGKETTLNLYSWCGISNGTHIFRSMTENRKRSRDEDTCEFMPLSKRINNLHINNRDLHVNTPRSSTSQQNGDSIGNNNSADRVHPQPSSPAYDPGLNSSQSHYYFENKLLFQLHLERIQRSGQQFPF